VVLYLCLYLNAIIFFLFSGGNVSMCFVTFVVIVAFIAVAFSCRLPLSKKCWSLVPVLFAPIDFYDANCQYVQRLVVWKCP